MSDIDVEGNRNRVAGRDYIELTVSPGKEVKEPLSSVQRQMLNALVQEVSVECEVDARILWREVVHARIGVAHVSQIPADRFLEVQDALVCYRDNHRKQANLKMMVSRITNFTKEKSIYEQRDAFCLRQFGEKHLNAMSSEQLRQLLVFVEDYQEAAKAAPAAEPAPVAPQSRWIEYKTLVMQYPWHFGWTCVFGTVIGKVFL